MSSRTTDGDLPAAPNLNGPATRHAHPSLAPAAGSVTSLFAGSNLPRSEHPALRPSAGGSAGGHVENVSRLILEAAGGVLPRG
jgi:hypothetical protein